MALEISGVKVDHVEIVPDGELRSIITASEGWRLFGLKVHQRATELAPGGMKKSMFVRFIAGPAGRIEIGSLRTVGKNHLSLLALIEEGTEPHYIPTGAPGNPQGGPLHFYWHKAGGMVTFAWVHHPGTKKNPFIQRAMQQIVHESLGIKLTPI